MSMGKIGIIGKFYEIAEKINFTHLLIPLVFYIPVYRFCAFRIEKTTGLYQTGFL